MPFVVFVPFIVIWLALLAYRFLLTAVPFTYSPNWVLAHWGTRFFSFHMVVEIGLVILLLVFMARLKQNDLTECSWCSYVTALSVLVSASIHIALMEWEVGHTTRVIVAGQPHAVDWTYRPYKGSRTEGYLRVEVVVPGYKARGKADSGRHLTIRATKSDHALSGVFDDHPRGVAVNEGGTCVVESYTRHCRFKSEGVWYNVSHGNSQERSAGLGPPLDELRRSLPDLFDKFIDERWITRWLIALENFSNERHVRP